MPQPFGHDEDLARPKDDRLVALAFDPERAFPAEEELVLIVLVPYELAVQLCDPDDGVVGPREVPWLPRFRDSTRGQRDIDLAPFYFAYSTARVSRMTVILI